MGPSDLIVVRTFSDRFAAEVAKTALEAAGITCLVRSDAAGGTQPGLWMGRGVELVVGAADAPRAAQILESPAEIVESKET